jgi:hypothetical protein
MVGVAVYRGPAIGGRKKSGRLFYPPYSIETPAALRVGRIMVQAHFFGTGREGQATKSDKMRHEAKQPDIKADNFSSNPPEN